GRRKAGVPSRRNAILGGRFKGIADIRQQHPRPLAGGNAGAWQTRCHRPPTERGRALRPDRISEDAVSGVTIQTDDGPFASVVGSCLISVGGWPRPADAASALVAGPDALHKPWQACGPRPYG